jgi:hypothetical protein
VIPGGKRRSVFGGVAAGAAAATAGAVVPTAASEVLQSGDSLAVLRFRQASASDPPGCTPAQFAMKSRWQVRLIALCCSAVGVVAEGAADAVAGASGVAARFTAGVGAGAGFATAVATGGFGAAGAGGADTVTGAGFATAVAAGGVGAAADAGGIETVGAAVAAAGAADGAACAGFAATGAGAGIVALTAVLQAGARLPTFFCRQVSASLPPGVTPEHFDMKSERQFERTALCCSGVTCAVAAWVNAATAAAITHGMSVRRTWLLSGVITSPHCWFLFYFRAVHGLVRNSGHTRAAMVLTFPILSSENV